MKKKKRTLSKVIAGASAGAVLGVATYLLLKTEKPNMSSEKHDMDKVKKEELFI